MIVLTDLMAGSVNQKFMPRIARPHTHLLTGMNLSLAMALTAVESTDSYLTEERINQIVDEARNQVQYVNVALQALSEDDEDE